MVSGREPSSMKIATIFGSGTSHQQESWRDFSTSRGIPAVHCDPRWLPVFQRGLKHDVYMVEARNELDQVIGILPLAFVKSVLFGKFLVSLPYLNWAGVLADDPNTVNSLVTRAIELARELDVRHLELRSEDPVELPELVKPGVQKSQLRLPISGGEEEIWKQLRSVVRTQVRKGEKNKLSIEFGRHDLIKAFYKVFSRNMRDLGTPVYPRLFFEEIIEGFPEAEFCVVRKDATPVASALAIHFSALTEIPSASCLKEYRSTAANSWMYWKLIQRATEHGTPVFDFGRSTIGGSTYKFKVKWGATPTHAAWQYFSPSEKMQELRPENPKYQLAIRMWRKLPLCVANSFGPSIVRGIP
ncbi:MAG: GNAT family N-acetyltransferase [Planctomycetaceae bacterium]|nr:GNAT family N-acetyltransferase [Planctomycetaceae bacterium]